AERESLEDPLLAHVRRLQLHLRAAVRDRVPRSGEAGRDLPEQLAVPERLGLRLGLRARLLDADLRRELRLVARHQPRAGRAEPLALALARMDDSDAGAAAQLRHDPGDRC